MNVNDEFFARGFSKIGNGLKTSLSEDVYIWLGDTPLAMQ
jgi:hypothetical protein